MVIGSLHNISGFRIFISLIFPRCPVWSREVMVNYFLELTELAKWNRFDTLAYDYLSVPLSKGTKTSAMI